MEEKRHLFHRFLGTHHHKARPTPTPAVHLLWNREDNVLAPEKALYLLREEDLREHLNFQSELVGWLLSQMRTYDCRKQRIVALVFDRDTVLSEVLRMPQQWQPEEEETADAP
jgi:hypothetical protein